MDPIDKLILSDEWIGDGTELARRVLAYAEDLREKSIPRVGDLATLEAAHVRTLFEDVADDLEALIRRELNPS